MTERFSCIQIMNHFSLPFRVFEGSTCLGISSPTEEFCVPLGSYRYNAHYEIRAYISFTVENSD